MWNSTNTEELSKLYLFQENQVLCSSDHAGKTPNQTGILIHSFKKWFGQSLQSHLRSHWEFPFNPIKRHTLAKGHFCHHAHFFPLSLLRRHHTHGNKSSFTRYSPQQHGDLHWRLLHAPDNTWRHHPRMTKSGLTPMIDAVSVELSLTRLPHSWQRHHTQERTKRNSLLESLGDYCIRYLR